jgi:hypothetical protein
MYMELRSTITRCINIDTLFRPNYESTKPTDFVFHFPETLDRVVSLKLSAMELPTIPAIDSTTNTFTVTNSIDTYTISIPLGTPTIDEIKPVINAQFIDLNVGLNFDALDGKAVFNVDEPDTYIINFTPVSCEAVQLARTAGWYMGFRDLTYTFDTSLVAEAAFGTVSVYVFLDLDDFNRNYVSNTIVSTNQRVVAAKPSPTTATSYIGNTVIARIVLSPDSNTFVADNGSDMVFKKREYFGPVRLDKLRVRLLDKFGYVVNLQEDFSFLLEAVCV